MSNDYHPRSRALFWHSVGVLVLMLLSAIAFLHFYEKNLDSEISIPVSEPKVRDAKPEFPEGRMEDGPALDDLPELPNVPAPVDRTDLIKVESLRHGSTVQSPLTVTGQARGNWFFEASFPIRVLDKDGKVIGQGHAEAQGEWMTENFVPWKATVSFIAPASGDGVVVFMKDNPSGLPEHDAQVRVPILFAHP
jgi:hypothetical protein